MFLKKSLKITGIIVSLSGCCSLSSALAADFSNLYFLGDSLSDIGNNPIAPIGKPGEPLWVQMLGNQFGKNITKSNVGGTDYAYAGAETGSVSQGALLQVAALLKDRNNNLDSNALYSLWIGGNDILNAMYSAKPSNEVINDGGKNIVAALNTLHAQGAKYILLSNIVDISDTYTGQQLSPAAQQNVRDVSVGFSQNMAKAVNNIGFDVIQLDQFSLFKDMIAKPSSFGFKHTNDRTCSASSPQNCAGYMFWDEVHPAPMTQRILSDYAYSVLVAPGYYAYLAESQFGVLKNQNDVVKAQLMQKSIANTQDRVSVFFSGGYAPNTKSAYETDRVANKNETVNTTVGGFVPVNENFLLGAAFGFNQNNTKLSGDLFQYDTGSSMISLLANYHREHFYLTGIANYAYLKYNNIERSIKLGVKNLVATGNTSGAQYGVGFDTGYLFPVVNSVWTTGPIANVTYQNVSVNGYAEGGNDAERYARLVFENQTSDSLATGIGWAANFKHPVNAVVMSGNLFVTGNHEWLTGRRDIGFHVLSMDGSHATLPVSTPRPYYVSAGAVFGLDFKNGWGVSLSYNGIFGGNNLQSNFTNIGLSKSF